jgi:non-heme chloroperoxidase
MNSKRVVSGLANASRRRVLATTLTYAISLVVNFTSAAGIQTIPPYIQRRGTIP